MGEERIRESKENEENTELGSHSQFPYHKNVLVMELIGSERAP